MKHSFLVFACLIVLLASVWIQEALGDVYALPDGLKQLEGQSYSLKAKMTILVGGKLSEMTVYEYFSSWQRRSRVDYRMGDSKYASDWLGDGELPRKGSVQADDRNVLLMKERASSVYCARLSRQRALKMFTMGALGTENERNEPQSLIGPSRLLHFIVDKVYKLILIDDSKILPHETFTTIPKMVKLVYNELPDGVNMSLFYSNNQADNLAYGVPKEMHLHLAKRMLVIYEFQQVKLLNQNSFINRQSTFITDDRLRFQHATIRPDADDLALDLFSWSRQGHCSRALRKSQLDDRLDLVGLDRREARFSFTAQPNYITLRSPVELIVGYEPSLSTLRVNKISQDETIESTINYQQMRHYNVLKRHTDMLNDFEVAFSDSQALDENPKSEANSGGRISCVMTEAVTVSARDLLSRGLKLGDMLLGSNKYTYLGRAKVRGIDALMFESPESEWPAWLEPSVLIYKSDNLRSTAIKQTVSRPVGGFLSDNEIRLSTVIYLSASTIGGQDQERGKSDYQEPIALDNKLLLMEFYEFHHDSNKLFRTFSVSIYDFAWHIVSSGIGDRNYIDFFAIADDCPSDVGAVKEQTRVDLVLAINRRSAGSNKNQSVSKFDGAENDESADTWLSNDIKRNLAILQAILFNLNLPTSLIYDFQSWPISQDSSRPRIEVGLKEIGTSRLADATQVAVSFQMVDHLRYMDKLVFLGIGCVKANSFTKFHRFALKFQECSILAAHQKLETVFGYNSILENCYVYVGRVAGPTLALLMGSTFDMERSDCFPRLEIYRTTRDLVKSNEFDAFQLRSSQKFNLTPVLDDGNEDACAGDPSWYNAEVIKSRTSQSSQAMTKNPDSDSHHLAFGLVPTSAMNTLIVANQDSDESTANQKSWAEAHLWHPLNMLTFGQCQAQCLVSPECDAFSTCRRGGHFECVLTRANLRSDAILMQLSKIAANKSVTNSQIFEIDLTPASHSDDDLGSHKLTAALRKHPACELHFKNYLDLTKRRDIARVRWAHDLARLKPVKDREECAQRCLQSTIRTIKEEVEPLARLSAEALGGPNADGNNLRELYKQHRAAHSKICPSFLYLDAQNCDSNLIERLHEIHAEIHDDETKWGGFCSIAGEQLTTHHKEMDMVGFEVVSEKHQMDFTMMYDKHFGIFLIESILTADEQAALTAICNTEDESRSLAPSVLKVIEAFMDRGENHVQYFYNTEDVTGCAKACFLTLPVWPACKSFSVEERFSAETGRHSLVCRLNSVTLSEVLANERYDLIGEQKSSVDNRNVGGNSTVLFWHYEPRRNLIGKFVDWTAKIQAEHDFSGPPKLPAGKSIIRLNPMYFLACVLSILVLGAKLGVTLGRRFITNLATIPEDNEILVNGTAVDHSDSLASGVPIEFKSLATCYEEPENEAKAEQEKNFDR